MSHSGKVFEGYTAGLRNVGSYQVSGIPWITGSNLVAGRQHKIAFPSVQILSFER